MTTERIDTVIFDLDETLANSSQRKDYLPIYRPDYKYLNVKEKNSLWTAYYKRCVNDEVYNDALWLVHRLQDTCNVIIVTARGEASRLETKYWLSKHNIKYSELIMRAEGDFSPAAKYKLGVFLELQNTKNINIRMAFDDNMDVTNLLRENGYIVYHVRDNGYEKSV